MIAPRLHSNLTGAHPHVRGGFTEDMGVGLEIEDLTKQFPGRVVPDEPAGDAPYEFDCRSKRKPVAVAVRTCRKCGCTDANCRGCIERTGEPCHWVEKDLCSACVEVAE